MAESRAVEAQGVNPVPASNRPSHPASWLSVADEGGVAPLALADPHGFRNRPCTAQAHASMDTTGESNPFRRVATGVRSVWSVVMECSEGLAPSDSRFTTWGLDAFGIEHACRAKWSGRLELHQRDVSRPRGATNYHALVLMVRQAGFEPAASRSQSGRAARLRYDRMARREGIEPSPCGLEPLRPPWPTPYLAGRSDPRPEGLGKTSLHYYTAREGTFRHGFCISLQSLNDSPA